MTKKIEMHLEEHKDRYCILIDAYNELNYETTDSEFVKGICFLFDIPFDGCDWWISGGELWIGKI